MIKLREKILRDMNLYIVGSNSAIKQTDFAKYIH